MSLWWRERLVIHLAPGSVSLTRWGRGVKPRLKEQHSYALESPAAVPSAAAAAGPWQAAIDLLDRALTEARWRRAEAHLHLSSHFLRFALLPFSAALATDRERAAFARLELEAIHGERVAGWTLSLDDAPLGAAAPVCAVDTALLEALRAAGQRAGLTLRAIRPAFAAALQIQRGRDRAPRYGFAFAEAGRVTLALYEGKACHWLTNPRVGTALTETLSAEVTQAQALGALGGGGRLQVVFSDRREALPPRIGAWELAVAEPGEPGARAFPVGALEVARH